MEPTCSTAVKRSLYQVCSSSQNHSKPQCMWGREGGKDLLVGERDVESHLEWRGGRRKSEDGGSSMQSSRLDIREKEPT